MPKERLNTTPATHCMTNKKTIFFDVSFTRLQTGAVGITRTVSRLEKELPLVAKQEYSFQQIAYSTCGWVLVEPSAPQGFAISAAAPQAPGILGNLYKLSSDIRIRRFVRSILPTKLLDLAWSKVSQLTYGRLTRRFPSARFSPGDILILADASWTYDVWPIALEAKCAGAKIVTMVYDLIPIRHPEYSSALITRVFERWTREAIANSDGLICISNAVQVDVKQYCSENRLPCPPIDHFRLGADAPTTFRDGKVRPHFEDLAKSAGNLFLIVGSIDPRKNHAIVLDTFERLWAAGVSHHLVIIGRPSDGVAPLIRKINGHPLLNKNLFCFFDANDAEVDLLYSIAQALIFASRAEGFGLPLVEARQRGRRVIASRIPVFEELKDDGVTLFDSQSPEELYQLLLHFETECTSCSHMPPFTWADSAAEFFDRLKKLLP